MNMKWKVYGIAVLLALSTLLVACDGVELGGLLGELMQNGADVDLDSVIDVVETMEQVPHGTEMPKTESPETVEPEAELPEETVADATEFEVESIVASVGLAFSTEGCEPGTCKVIGIGTCTDTELVIPARSPDGDMVVGIGEEAFWTCHHLTSVILPEGLVTLENLAFAGCNGLTSMVIPDGVTSLGAYAFGYCSNLTRVAIPNSVEIIGEAAFYGCELLKDVYYTGTEPEWSAMEIAIGNDTLKGAAIHDCYVP